jgi:hypothetical protein
MVDETRRTGADRLSQPLIPGVLGAFGVDHGGSLIVCLVGESCRRRIGICRRRKAVNKNSVDTAALRDT